jgi:hypothetical protein
MAKSGKGDSEAATKDYQREKDGSADSNRQFREAGHDARNDSQDSGEDLPKRDRSSK